VTKGAASADLSNRGFSGTPLALVDSTPTSVIESARAWQRWACVSLLTVIGAAIYWPTLSVPLLLDDIASIAENPSIRQLWPLGPALSPPADVGLGGRPIANLSFALNYQWSGTSVRGYHATNIAIHLAAAIVLFELIRLTVLRARPRPESAASVAIAFAAALLWLLHPLQTQAVTYLSQRTESLMGLLYLTTLYAFAQGALRQSSGWSVVAVASCALGMGTKEVMVTAPVIVLL
jgi:protein O-mannosyl-transferase